LDVYKTEDEQVETIRKWWEENGKSALFGIVLGLGAIFGWRTWQANIIAQAEAASDIYQQSLAALNQDARQEARRHALEIIGNYPKTGYAVFARLILASLATDDADYNSAEEHLIWALDNVKIESLKHEVRLRLAQVHIAAGKYDQALSLLNIGQQGAFAPLYNELRGDVYVLQNNPAEARAAYQQALLTARSSSVDQSILNVKIDSLGQ